MLRNTIQRTLTLNAVRSMTTHPTADEIYEAVSKQCSNISKGTVYRLLGNLANEGEIRRIPIANAPDRFDLTLEPHAHFYCKKCGRVFDCPLPTFQKSDNPVPFTIESTDVVYSGYCNSCSEKH